jgi:DeoR family fructose operon transcriptional repressor
MKQRQRIQFILDKIKQDRQVGVQDIVQAFQVSEITARRDLMGLEQKGLLLRTHGGAVHSPSQPKGVFSFDEKSAVSRPQKEHICQIAAGLIEEGDTIFIDSGSTLFYMCQHLKHFRQLIVITNSLPVVSQLIGMPNIKVNLIGGEVDPERRATHGMIAEQNLEKYYTKKAFIGTDGVSIKMGLTAFDEKSAATSRKIAFASQQVFLLCDASKIEQNSMVQFAPLQVVTTLITDPSIATSTVGMYAEHGLSIIF